MPPLLPAAVLWDMDGTLVDSEHYWIAEEFALVESFGGQWSLDHAHELVGSALLDSAAYIIDHTPVTLSPEAVVARLVAGVAERLAQEVPWRAGARELLAAVGAAGVPSALVTMSYAVLARLLVDAAGPGLIHAVVSGDDVAHGKPHPEPYLRAAAALGAHPGDCIAIEDSFTGARSAVAAGVPTIVVPHIVSVPEWPGTVQVATLEGRTLEDLMDLTSCLRHRDPRAQSSAGVGRPTT
ncbi:MAG: HAD family phosphatase [Dermatophilaceae bacterium]